MNRIRVVQFGTYWATPLVARCLAGFGCDVVSVVRSGDGTKAERERERLGVAFDELRVGVRVVEADLPRDLERLRSDLACADIVVEGFGHGVAERLGIGFEAVRAMHAKVLYASVPGFAEGEPTEGFEAAILAAAGVFRDMGLNRSLMAVEASYTHRPLASVYGGIYALFGILAAWYGEQRGCRLCFPLAASLSETMVHNSIDFAKDLCYMSPRARALLSGERHVTWDRLRELTCPFFRTYECAGGGWIYLVSPSHKLHQQRTVEVLGVEREVAAILREVDPYHQAGAGLGCGSLSDAQTAKVLPVFETAFAKKTAEEWDALLGSKRVPTMVVRTTEEWIRHPHVRESGLVDTDGHLANVAWLTNPSPMSPVSSLSSATSSCELSSIPSHSPSSPHSAPLGGVRVLDLTNVIAGPTISQCLARLGAEVTKIDPCVPTYSPEVTIFYGIPCNRGKHSVLLDVTREEGRQCLKKLVETSDVLVVNATLESLVRLSLTEDTVRSWNPQLIFARFDAWGGPSGGGELCERIGYDDCVQAGTGIMMRYGGGRPEEHAHIGTIDHIAGVSGAVGILCALVE